MIEDDDDAILGISLETPVVPKPSVRRLPPTRPDMDITDSLTMPDVIQTPVPASDAPILASPQPVFSHLRFEARIVEGVSDERLCQIDFHRARRSYAAFFTVTAIASGKSKGVAAATARAKYMATDCFGISKRSNMLQHRAMMIHLDTGTHKKVMMRAWSKEADELAWAVWDAFNSAVRDYKGNKRLPSRSSSKSKPRESMVSEDIRERERMRYMPKGRQDALVRSRSRSQSKDSDLMPRGQGRRMQTAIKRTTSAERPRAAKRVPTSRRGASLSTKTQPTSMCEVPANTASGGESFAATLLGAPRSLGSLRNKKSESRKRLLDSMESEIKRRKTSTPMAVPDKCQKPQAPPAEQPELPKRFKKSRTTMPKSTAGSCTCCPGGKMRFEHHANKVNDMDEFLRSREN